MVKVMGIDFVDFLRVPMQRRLQTLAVMLHVSLFIIAPILTVSLSIYMLTTSYYWLIIAYFAWMYYDLVIVNTPAHGGRKSMWFRKMRNMEYFRDYFPLSLVKTSELSTENNYIFGYHPHGIMGCGAFCNFASEATGFSEKFPGIEPHMLTLRANFYWPFLRGYLLWMGACDVSKESINWILTKKGKGNAAVIVIGGAEEALDAHPGVYRLTLKKRKGFVKIAIKTGASLVPVFCFGENDLYQQVGNPKGSLIRKFQEQVKHFTGISPPVFFGRGVFNYTFGFLPFRRPINTIVGKPIPTEKCEEPTQEVIDAMHARYMKELSDLFDEHKVKYGVKEELKLSIV